MNKKTLFILLGIFVILGIAASSSMWGEYLNVGKKSSSNAELNFSEFSESTTDKISIAKNSEEEIIISKENSVWVISGFDADQRKIDDFFETLASLNIESLVSKNPENHSNFDVTVESGFILTITSNNTNSSFIIGKQGATFSSFYIKAKESDNVYEVSGNLRDKLSQSITAWRDKTVVKIPKETIQKIEVVSKTDPLVVANNDGAWNAERFDKTVTLDESTANRLLAALNPLEASGFLNEEEQKKFRAEKNTITIRIFGSSETIIAEISLFEKESDWWAMVKGQDIFYKIPSYKLSSVFLADEEIFGGDAE